MAIGEPGGAANATEDTDHGRGRVPADTFSNRLILTRSFAGHLSIREACERTGLNRGSWQGWERGLRPRDQVEVCRAVAEGLDVDFEWLLFGGPLAGPKGRLVRTLTKRVREDTDRYPSPSVRPSTVRPMSSHPTNRCDQRPAGVVRPEIIYSPLSVEG